MKRPPKVEVLLTRDELEAAITALQLTDDDGAYGRANPGQPVAALRRALRKLELADYDMRWKGAVFE